MGLAESRFFQKADRVQGNVLTPSDAIMVISGYEHLTFNVRTNSLPMIKNDKVEYSTTHGTKTYSNGKLQTLNDFPVTFMERDTLVVKNTLEEILLSGENEELEITFYTGSELASARLWGTLTGASIFIQDNPEADSEATTSAMTISANVTGHYYPPALSPAINLIDTVLAFFKS